MICEILHFYVMPILYNCGILKVLCFPQNQSSILVEKKKDNMVVVRGALGHRGLVGQ